jgi:hypothetical protein
MNAFRGETSVEMGGKARVLKFGTNATALFCQLHNIGLGDFASYFSPERMTPAHYRDLIYCALASGARKTGVDFTNEDVGDWLDEMTEDQIAGIFDVFSQSSPKGEAEGKPTG